MAFNSYYLQQSGFYEFVLPFLLVFAVTYAVFSYAKREAEKPDRDTKERRTFILDNKAIVIISVILGFFATAHEPLRGFLFRGAPIFIIILIILFFFLLVTRIFGKKDEKDKKGDWLPILVLLMLIIIMIGAIGMPNFERYLGLGAENIVWGIGFLLFVMILWVVHRAGQEATEATKPTKEGER